MNAARWIFIAALTTAAVASADVKVDDTIIDVRADTPTRVTMELNNVTPGEAFDAVCAKAKIPSGVMIVDQNALKKRITLSLKDVPLAEAMLRVAAASNLSINRWNGEFGYQAGANSNGGSFGENWTQGPVQCVGP